MATAAAVDEIPEFDRPYVNDRPEHLRSATSRLKKKKKGKRKKKFLELVVTMGLAQPHTFLRYFLTQ
jgi:hypothetical protein